AMLFGFSITLFCKLYFSERQLTVKQILSLSFGNLLLIFALWAIIGYFNSGSGLQNNDFGIFSSNLNTLFNSQNITQLLPALPIAKFGQYEGFGYLGVGGLLVFIIGLVLGWKPIFTSKFKSLLPLLIFTFLASLFAFSGDWTFNEHTFLSVDYPKFLTKQFRSSGRFIWILHYLVLALGIWGINKLSIATFWKIAVLSIVIALQFWDVQPLLTQKHIRHNGENFAYKEKLWTPALENANRIITYPPYIWDFVQECDQAKLTHLAALYDLPITCGRTVYGSSKQKSTFRTYLDQQIEQEQLADESQTLFLTTMEYLSKFQPLLQQNVVQGFVWDDYLVFLPHPLYEKVKDSYPAPLKDQLLKMRTESLIDFIANRSDKIILISAKDEASKGLNTDFKDFMREKGSQIDDLQFRRSYAAVFENGKLLEEQIGNSDSSIVRIGQANFLIESGGRFAGNKSSIQIEGKEYSLNKRGMNIIVLDNGEVVEVINYDTYQSIFHNFLAKKEEAE
ncbi:MAG: interleukin-like EMT inducer domain-containing protein, partial [Bacteroidota bacterium]